MNRNPVLVRKSIITDIKKIDAANDAASIFMKKSSLSILIIYLCYNTIFVNTVTSKINFFIPKKTSATRI